VGTPALGELVDLTHVPPHCSRARCICSNTNTSARPVVSTLLYAQTAPLSQRTLNLSSWWFSVSWSRSKHTCVNLVVPCIEPARTLGTFSSWSCYVRVFMLAIYSRAPDLSSGDVTVTTWVVRRRAGERDHDTNERLHHRTPGVISYISPCYDRHACMYVSYSVMCINGYPWSSYTIADTFGASKRHFPAPKLPMWHREELELLSE